MRDIESLLRVNFGVRVDYRRVSLVQMQEERLFQAEGRPRLAAVRSFDGPNRRAEVEMEKDGHIFIGTAQSSDSNIDAVRLVCMATIEAMEQVLGEHVTYHVGDIKQIELNKIQAIVVSVTLDFGTSQEMLFGICHVHVEPADAAARATLNAVNRRLLLVKPEAGAAHSANL